MSLILKFLGGPFGTWVLIAVAAILLGMGLTIRGLWNTRTELLKENGALTTQLQMVVGDNKSQSVTITKLEAANKSWVDLLGDAHTKQATLIELSQQNDKLITALKARLTTAEQADHANPDCQKILAIDLSASCPAIASGLHERAGRH